jgi:ATPase subunit of ABC transporter with duplicated ATPase domains
MNDYPEVMLFTSRDHQLMQTVANRIIEITPKGVIDKLTTFDDYITDEQVKTQKIALYA